MWESRQSGKRAKEFSRRSRSAIGKAVLLGYVLAWGGLAQPLWVDRVAGNPSVLVDGISARDAPLSGPDRLAFDASGNLHIADIGNHTIRKVDLTGVITTVVGTGQQGSDGDGGPAANSSLSGPTGIAFDRLGNLYIADCGNNRIRKVDSAGIITTVAGKDRGFAGDGGPAANASLACPADIEFNSAGNLYFSDYRNHRIRKIDPSGIVTTVAGTGNGTFGGDNGAAVNASLSRPQGIAFDRDGSFYIADTANNRVRKIDRSGTISTVAGTGDPGFGGDGGPATDAQLLWPRDIALDQDGNLYIVDSGLGWIRKVDTAGMITTVAGTGDSGGDCGQAVSARLVAASLAVDSSGSIYFADRRSRTIRRLSNSRPVRCGAGYSPLSSWSVSAGEVSFASFRSRGCLGSSDFSLPEASYVIHSSEWQRRAPGDSVWATVDGTLRAGRVCAYTPTEPGQYRAVAEISVGDGERTTYRSSNDFPGPAPAVANTQPTFGGGAIADQTYAVGTAISPLTLPRVRDGDGDITYSLTPSVPGLAFNASTRRLAGSPTTAGSYAMSYIARDADGDTVTLQFTITVNEPSPPSEGDYMPLDDWTVSDGRVQFLFFSAGRCVNLGGSTLNGVTYTVHNSKWQRRDDSNSAWTDISGTEHTGGLCSYSPTEPGQYRGVAEISIDGTRGRYSTKNILTEP